MKKSTKIIIMISLVAILGTAAYFIYDNVAKQAQGEFRDTLASADIYNPDTNPNGTKQIIKKNNNLVMTDTTTNEEVGVTPVEGGNNMPFPLTQESAPYGVYDNVKKLQTFLLFANPDLVLTGGIDGKFGASTAAAVKQEVEGFFAQGFNALWDDLEAGVDTSNNDYGELYGEYGYDPIINENGTWDYDAMDVLAESVTKQYYDEVVLPEFNYFTQETT